MADMRKYIEKKESNLRDVYGWVLATVEIVCGMFQLGFGWFWAAKIEGWSRFSRKCLAIYQQNWTVDLTKMINSKHIISAPMGLRASHFGPYPWLATHSRAYFTAPFPALRTGQFQAMALCCPNTGRRPPPVHVAKHQLITPQLSRRPPGRECRTTTRGRATNACLLPIRVASEGRLDPESQPWNIADLAPYPISYW